MLTLILGGARSGKSAYAQDLARAHPGRVVYAATAHPSDDEMGRRIDRHRKDRPASWETVELDESLEPLSGCAEPGVLIVLDCLSVFVSNVLVERGVEGETATSDEEAETWDDVERNLTILTGLACDVVVVSNEVGMGVVPATALGRLFRDVQGRANQWLAERASRVVMVVAGIAQTLKDAQ